MLNFGEMVVLVVGVLSLVAGLLAIFAIYRNITAKQARKELAQWTDTAIKAADQVVKNAEVIGLFDDFAEDEESKKEIDKYMSFIKKWIMLVKM